MNRMILAAFLVCTGAAALNGSVEYTGQIKTVNLWGSWEEMGYAHGYLLGPDLMEMYESYFLELAGGIGNIEQLRELYPLYFNIPPEFSQYAGGIISGAADTVSLWSSVYGRELDTLDILIVSSVPDLSAMVDFRMLMCSSTSGWGEATSGDPVLQGATAVARNLDYYVDSQETILGKSMLFVHDPLEGQDWITVSFPGFMGSLSGMNESGLNATLNMGNHTGTSQTSPAFVPICMALALGLCSEDFDGSGACDVNDLKEAAIFWNRSNSYDIHITAPVELAAGADPAVIAEINNHSGYAFRYSSHEPAIAPGRLLLTNHHRVLYPPVTCSRYQRLLDSLETDPQVTLDRLWNFMASVGEIPVPGAGGTLQTMIFLPEERRTGLALASSGTAPYSMPPLWIQWNDLYPNHAPQGVGAGDTVEDGLTVQCNPAASAVTVYGPVGSSEELGIYDLSGRRVQAVFTETGSGVFTAQVGDLEPAVYFVAAGEHRVQVLILGSRF